MQDGLTKDVESVDTRKSVPTVSHRPVSPSSKMWHLCYYKRDIEPMRLDSNVINWVESVKYLGVLLVVGGRKLLKYRFLGAHFTLLLITFVAMQRV